MNYLKIFKLFESITKHVFDNRIEYWNDKDQRHRKNGPAVEWISGTKEWYLNGQKHREDGPAVIHKYGDKHWYLNGKRHREDGPAVEYTNGSKAWYLNGERHREDGPAIEYYDGNEYWYLNDNQISELKFIQKLTDQNPNPNLFKDLSMEDLEELSDDLCDEYSGEVKKWFNFYAIYFKEKLNKDDPDLKSFENRIGDFRIRVGNKSILIY